MSASEEINCIVIKPFITSCIIFCMQLYINQWTEFLLIHRISALNQWPAGCDYIGCEKINSLLHQQSVSSCVYVLKISFKSSSTQHVLRQIPTVGSSDLNRNESLLLHCLFFTSNVFRKIILQLVVRQVIVYCYGKLQL